MTPLSRAFITLNEICAKSLTGSQANSLFACLFALVDEILGPMDVASGFGHAVDVTSLEWILLFISRLLSAIDKPKDFSSRWDFLENIYSGLKSNSKQFNAMRNKYGCGAFKTRDIMRFCVQCPGNRPFFT